MLKGIIAGIGLGGNTASLTVIEHHDHEKELLYLDTLERADNSEFWYLELLDWFAEQSRTKLNQVAIAVDPSAVTIIQCPMDNSLNQTERNQHINWELSQYIEDYHPQQYVNDVHILETDPEVNVQNILIVSVTRQVIYSLQKALAERHLPLGIVDVNHFATDGAIVRSYPDSEKTLCCSLGVGPSRIDASILQNGQKIAYHYTLPKTDDEMQSFVSSLLNDHPVSSVYLWGSHLTRETEKLIRSLTSVPVVILNPFRRTVVSPNFRTFSHYANSLYRFASSAGIALRTS
jgi:Tfp pilus assembly PilM family ATPase